ncbi:uncharacterized protein MELLADRAFT_90766 [Melampsora larici-populina 98AG31]|uniref:C2H2-type domain-containing protein n=1 Tax=Melampsora larici-populina (strain 98AG31 / pathotype 3-4-7) TaxID=747676 RepID=F4R7E6_MELLP|nr:uncharacterized protein MELLADRAFT_90766 [Melampsora larici-populina 98AG31]EGG11800.1 hypothetical protein MELLADRAFT_90766 [Melampsora larici-populina 98AG31]
MSSQTLLPGIVEEDMVLYDGVPRATEPDIPVWNEAVVTSYREVEAHALANQGTHPGPWSSDRIDFRGPRAPAPSAPHSASSPHTSSEVSAVTKNNKIPCDQCHIVSRDKTNHERHKRTHIPKEVLRQLGQLWLLSIPLANQTTDVCCYNGCEKDYKNVSDVERHQKTCIRKPKLDSAQSGSTSTTHSRKPLNKRKAGLVPGKIASTHRVPPPKRARKGPNKRQADPVALQNASTSMIPPPKRARKGPNKIQADPVALQKASNYLIPDIIVPQGGSLIISDDVIDPALAYYL